MVKDVALTPLGVMVLALLRERDMHPYEMLRLLRERRADRMVRVTNGTLYHTVGRLDREGLIVPVGTGREGNRPERTTYRLTAAGPWTLAEWVRGHLARVDRTLEFRVALAEAHNLGRDEVAALIGARRAALADELATTAAGLASAREKGIAEQYVIEIDRQETLLRAELAWTDSFLDRLARTDYPWGSDNPPPDHLPNHRPARKAAQH